MSSSSSGFAFKIVYLLHIIASISFFFFQPGTACQTAPALLERYYVSSAIITLASCYTLVAESYFDPPQTLHKLHHYYVRFEVSTAHSHSHSCTLKMEAIRSSETSVLVRATRCHHHYCSSSQKKLSEQGSQSIQSVDWVDCNKEMYNCG
jgi:hypothetical protein